MMVIMFFVITVPFLALKPRDFIGTVDPAESQFVSLALNCTNNYTEYQKDFQDEETTFEKVLDFLLGTVSIGQSAIVDSLFMPL